MKNLFSFLLLAFTGVTLSAQHFRWEAPVNPVDAQGYTRILLPPDVTGETHDPFRDIRIYDNDHTEIPFLGVFDRVVAGVDRFVEYPVVDKHNVAGDSWITVENPLYKTDALHHLVLEVNKTDVRRRMSLVGSYDGQTWYALKDDFYFTSCSQYENGAETTTDLVEFDFPNSDYRFFRFHFDNWSEWWRDYAAPVFVVRAGVLVNTTPHSVKDNLMAVPGVTLVQNENTQLKISEIDITFTGPQFVDVMRFTVSTSNPTGKFFRGAQLYRIDDTSATNKVRSETLLSSCVLSAEGLNEFQVTGKVKHLALRIINYDDQPVHVEAVNALQLKHYLLAYLEPGKKYVVQFGNDSITSPQYDLRYLADSLTMYELPVVTTGTRTRLPDVVAATVAAESPLADKGLMWGAMAVVVIILAWMSVKMLREMKQKQ